MDSELELERERAIALRLRLQHQDNGPGWLERGIRGVSDFISGDSRIAPEDRGIQELPSIRAQPFEGGGSVPSREPGWLQRQAAAIDDFTGAKFTVPDDAKLPAGVASAQDVLRQRRQGSGDAQARMGFAAEDTGKIGVLEAITGKLPQRTDENGNIIVRITPEKAAELSRRTRNPIEAGEYFIDRPGLSGQDVWDNAPEALLGAVLGPAGKLTGLARTGVVGAYGAAESVVSDVVAQMFGSEDAVSGARAVFSGLGAAGADAVLRFFARKIAGDPKLVDDSGALTDTGRAVAKRLGIDIDQIGPDLERQILQEVKRGANAGDAAVVAEASNLPSPVPLTRGQATGEAGAQMLEDQAVKGAFGRNTELAAREARDVQSAALEANVDAIGRGMSGADMPSTSPAVAAQRSLVQEREAAEAGVNAAYDAARQAKAGVPAGAVQQATMDFRASIRDYSPRAAPVSHGFIDDLNEIGTKAGNGALPVDELAAWRRQVTTFASTTNDRTEASAARELVRAFDDKAEDWTKAGIIQGDQDALEKWAAAVSKRREVGKMFQAGDIVEILTTRGKDGELPAEGEVLSRIFGSKGFTPGAEMAKALRTLKGRLPEEQWNALRQEAWLRLVSRTRGPMQATGEQQLSGAKMLKAINELQRDHPQVWKTLFTEDERNLIGRFARTLNRVTTPVEGGKNFSNTASAVATQMRTLFNAGLINGRGLRALVELPVINAAVRSVQGFRAAGSFNNPLRKVPLPLNGAVVGAGAAAGQEGG